jgi:hypothetical protein
MREVTELRQQLAEARAEMELGVRLEVRRLHGKGFAAYINGSASEGTAVIVADLHAILYSCLDNGESWKRVTAESCVHELLHAFQEILSREFDEYEVEAAMRAAEAGVDRDSGTVLTQEDLDKL